MVIKRRVKGVMVIDLGQDMSGAIESRRYVRVGDKLIPEDAIVQVSESGVVYRDRDGSLKVVRLSEGEERKESRRARTVVSLEDLLSEP